MKRKYTNDFKINNTPMLMPDAGIQVEYEDLLSSDSGRDEAGYLHNIVLRKDMRRWRFTYAFLTAEEYTYVRSLLKGKHDFSFTFKNENGQTETVTAQCNQTSVCYWSQRRGLYKDFQFEIYEM